MDIIYIQNTNILIYRNFLDSAVSYRRVSNDKKNDFIVDTSVELNFVINNYIHYIEELFKYRSELDKLLIFNYETDIYMPNHKNNYDVIFNKIETYFNIKIDNKNEIIESTNFNLNKQRSMSYNTFKKWDLDNMIHGNHVIDGSIGSWCKHINKSLHITYSKSKLYRLNNEWNNLINEESL